MTTVEPDFEWRVVRGSILFRIVIRFIAIVSGAWKQSRAGGAVRRSLAAWREAPVAEQVRFVAGAVASACAGHGILLLMVPSYAAPAWPPAVAGIAAAGAALAAMFAQPIASAWRDSAVRRSTTRPS